MKVRTILKILFYLLISTITAAQTTITFDKLGWDSDQVLDSTFTIDNFKVESSQKFCTNYGSNFDVNGVSIYFVFQHKTDQIIVTAMNNLYINLNSIDVYQVSEQSTDNLVIEGWNGTVKEYSKSFANDTRWTTFNLNYKNINKVIIKLDSSGNGGISDYNFDNFSFSVSPTPVELVEFKANVEESNINLEWKTATEINNYGFEIERQTANDDNHSSFVNSQWSDIGFVKGNGNSNSPKNYSFTDNSIKYGYKYKYRLKQIDNDGDYKYSSEIEVTVNSAPKDYSLSQNYPNPFNPSTTINYQLAKTGKVVLKVYDILGKEVAALVNEYKDAGNYSVEFSAEAGTSHSVNLPSGIYIYELRVNNYRARNKMMLVK